MLSILKYQSHFHAQGPQRPFSVGVRTWVKAACPEAYSFHDLPHLFLEARSRISRAIQGLVQMPDHVSRLVPSNLVLIGKLNAEVALHWCLEDCSGHVIDHQHLSASFIISCSHITQQ